MWVARFELRDEEDIYTPLCEEYNIELFVRPISNYERNKKINLLLAGTISGTEENKKKFLKELRKEKNILSIEKYKDFLFIHAQQPISREARAEIKIFYNPEYIILKPVHLRKDGWEKWEIGCLNREELNKIIRAAKKYYNGRLLSLKQEKIKGISNFEYSPEMTENQIRSVKLAFEQGYYEYPRKKTLLELAKISKKAYSTFQEHLSKAEAKIVKFFIENK